jgi:hypothetical protein
MGVSRRIASTIRPMRAGSSRPFRDAGVDIFASTHTAFPRSGISPAFTAKGWSPTTVRRHAELFGRALRPRHAHLAPSSPARLFGVEVRGTHVEALPVRYDTERWIRRFLSAWPEGSPAHASYFTRIVAGPAFGLERAAPLRIAA